MAKPPLKTCILIPAYNEEKRVGAVVREVLEYCPDVIVVDDGSPDDTDKVAAEAGAIVLEHVHNQGKGAALQTGFDYAREHGYDLAITLDADGQHAPSDIPAFLQAYERTHSHVLVGNRMGDVAAMPRLRRFVNRFMSDLLS
ncbi:MAG TPA: glycosyltransferase family 2 protein, partial [Kiritimatiellia bacterium]|nr:glycosyltransferase family 2 protein [Kiritimatiellia bacterium]